MARHPIIYFDYNATTPLDSGVREVMDPLLGEMFGNPSSVHSLGRQARALLDDGRERVAKLLGCRSHEVIFTSGGTESNNLAIFGSARLRKDKGKHLITSPTEHHAVLHCLDYLSAEEGFEVTLLPVDRDGRIDPDALRKSLRKDTILVSIMSANNESGTLQPVGEIGEICRERGVLFHTDAAQSFGKECFKDIHVFSADLVSFCAHKFHGPKGSGGLFIRSPLHPDPIHFGGAQENDRRAGTENLFGILGLVEALERFIPEPVFPYDRLWELTCKLGASLERIDGVQLRGSPTYRLSNTLALTVEGCDSPSLVAALDLEGVCASSGSACSTGSPEPSHVARAMGCSEQEANSFIRFSLGRESTSHEVSLVVSIMEEIVARIRSSSRIPR